MEEESSSATHSLISRIWKTATPFAEAKFLMAARLLTESKAFSNMLDTMLLGCGCQRSSPWVTGLKTGGGSSGGSGNTFHYTFHGDPHATFASFFGGSNPFDIFFASSRSRVFNGFDQEDMDIDDDDDPFSAFGRFGFNGINGVHRRHQESLHTRRKVQDPPVIHELKVSLAG
ncbi:DnaJ-like protein subfamily B member 5 [Anas platyrhynchos]|uniref:DnaJ-like protein subfamily B member 5 n=1 Tax=Anas platyrhynchos TaxID=8839 RepID=R0LM45_ANAPL|nr:DnaJ-like protein subfamily B member 5 [Anas platyrhynchos]